MAAGWLVDGRPVSRGQVSASGTSWLSRTWREGRAFALLGAAPDLDLLVGLHSTYTHSVAAAVLVAGAAFAVYRHRSVQWALACGAALASHILLDWLGSDTTPPIGIMALWPFSSAFYQSPLCLFPAVSRRFSEWSFVTQNLQAVAWELAILVPLVVCVGWIRGARQEKTRADPGNTKTPRHLAS